VPPPEHPHGRVGTTEEPRKDHVMGKTFGLKPLEDRIAVHPSEEEQTTVSGIVIPDTAKEKPQEGEVMAVGPGRFEDGQRIPMDVKVGDKVIYSKYGGTEVKVDGDEYLILSARDVLAVISAARKAS
jgi:chaperonin GroES